MEQLWIQDSNRLKPNFAPLKRRLLFATLVLVLTHCWPVLWEEDVAISLVMDLLISLNFCHAFGQLQNVFQAVGS